MENIDKKVTSGILIGIGGFIILLTVAILFSAFDNCNTTGSGKLLFILFMSYVIFSIYWGSIFLFRKLGLQILGVLIFFPPALIVFLLVAYIIGMLGVGIYEFIFRLNTLRH